MAEKQIFSREIVRKVFLEIWRRFDPAPSWSITAAGLTTHCGNALCDRMCATGGFRRGKREMKDLEILFIPRIGEEVDPGDLFGASRPVNLTEQVLSQLEQEGIISRRLSISGNETWGPLNKHARHVATGLAVDLFAATRENWWNRMVVTTGPAELNIRIAGKARELGWEWEVYQAGFVPRGGNWDSCPRERRTMRSEREVFDFVKMPHMRPEDRRAA